MQPVGSKLFMLLIELVLCIDITYCLTVVFHQEGDSVALKCPVEINSRPPIWRKNKVEITTDNKVVVNRSNDLYGRIKIHGLQIMNLEHIIEIQNLTKTDNETFCCVTTNSAQIIVQHCTDVYVLDEDDITINVTEEGLFCSLKYKSGNFSYSWMHFSSSGHHLKCDDVEGNFIYLNRVSPFHSEGKYVCVVHIVNKSIKNYNGIHKAIEIKENGNISCEGRANVEYLPKRNMVVISFLVQRSFVWNHTWKRNDNDITLISPLSTKFASSVQITKTSINICDESIRVNSTVYRLEIKDVVATDFNQIYILEVSNPKEYFSCSHNLTQNELGDNDTRTEITSFHVLAFVCLALPLTTFILVILRKRPIRRQVETSTQYGLPNP